MSTVLSAPKNNTFIIVPVMFPAVLLHELQLLSTLTWIRGLKLAKLSVTHLIGSLECDQQMGHPVTSQVLPPLSKRFLWALYQMNT